MKKLLMFVVLIFVYTVHANDSAYVATLCAKVVASDGKGFFILSDGSYWKTVGFVKRTRSIAEWWNNVELAPKNYECVPNDWFIGAQIACFLKSANLTVDESNASNIEELKQCTHLLVNQGNEQILFAVMLDPATCLTQIFNQAYQDGYDKGNRDGRSSGQKNNSEQYEKGRSDGYTAGYQAGYQQGVQGMINPGANNIAH